MQQLILKMPHEDMIYFGDTARVPYGEKGAKTITRFSKENTEFLIECEAKLIVVACNTASAIALEELEQTFNIPFIGTIEPCAEIAVNVSKNGRIGVLGTKGTINSKAYEKALLRYDPTAVILPIACPLFVPLVEERFTSHQAAKLIVKEYLKPFKESKIDTLILGCTHYSFMKDLIANEIDDHIAILDSATSCAVKTAQMLAHLSLKSPASKPGNYRYYVSDDPEKFSRLGSFFLKKPIQNVQFDIRNGLSVASPALYP